jgi:hypothetical protein
VEESISGLEEKADITEINKALHRKINEEI